jgi:tRNA pseudouridine55 synthase
VTDLSGLLLVDKPEGPTSHDLVAELRRQTGISKVGHAGTLDPFASGLLLLLVGAATRLSEYLLHLRKGYTATARLGSSTTTHDREGAVVARSEDWRALTKAEVEAALSSFRGKIRQDPPLFSAKKIRGQPAHRRMRRGETVVLEPVEVDILEMELLAFEPPDVTFRVLCSSGTYVRALGRDLGEFLGVGAHLIALRRNTIGGFDVEDALAPADLGDRGRIAQSLLEPALALTHLPSHEIGRQDAARVANGQALMVGDRELPEGIPIAIMSRGQLLAVGRREGDRLQPRKVLNRG